MINCYHCHNDLSYQVEIIVDSTEMRFNCYDQDKVIVKCSYCDLVQLIPQWTDEELNKIYSQYSKKEDFKGHKIKEHDYPKYLDKYIKKNDIILEIGCSFGNNVISLKELGYNIYGFDKDPTVCDEKTIFNLDNSILGNEEYKDTFNVIYGIHLLEHIKDPIKFLNECHNALKEKGKLILEFPNIEEPLLTIWKNKIFNLFYWIPDHLFFYTPQTIKELLKNTYFKTYKIIRKQRYGIINHLNWLIRKKPCNFNVEFSLLDIGYKFILTNFFKKSDTLILVLEK